MAKIVAFGHRKRTGKDTAGGLLRKHLAVIAPELRVEEVSFAAKLKEISYDLFGWGGLQPGPYYELPENAHLREVVLPLLGKTPRQIWIEVGNLMRQVHSDVWINNALFVPADIVIVRDLRYHNEADIIEAKGGDRYKMVRDGVPVSNDVADVNLDNYTKWSGIIYNNGTITDLSDKMVDLAEKVVRDVYAKPLATD
jgi:hypothetical protein